MCREVAWAELTRLVTSVDDCSRPERAVLKHWNNLSFINATLRVILGVAIVILIDL